VERSAVDLSDVVAFLGVVETGSFARAAERLSLAKLIFSRRLARLETTIGTRLLTRSARGAVPTELGRAYFTRAANSVAKLEAAYDRLSEAMAKIAGPLRLTGPMSFGIEYLAPALADFAAARPRVELDVSFDDRTVDLVGGFDIGVRLGSLAASSLVVRKLAPLRRVLLASPGILVVEGMPQAPRDLAGQPELTYANAGTAETWGFRNGERWQTVRVASRLRADNGKMLRAAAVAGLGYTVLPTFIAARAITAGTLAIVLLGFPLDSDGVYAVMPPWRGATAPVRALVDFLAARFGPESPWDPCWLAERNSAAAAAAALDSPVIRAREVAAT
jgi:DNA-binding transcriptional LysR family regulator